MYTTLTPPRSTPTDRQGGLEKRSWETVSFPLAPSQFPTPFYSAQQSSCVAGWAHTVYYMRSICTWKIPPTYTLKQSVSEETYYLFSPPDVCFSFLGHQSCDSQSCRQPNQSLSIRCRTFLARLISPARSLIYLIEEFKIALFPGPFCRRWITKRGNGMSNDKKTTHLWHFSQQMLQYGRWRIAVFTQCQALSHVHMFTGYKSS